jgi:DNA polymerase-1
MWQSLDRAGLSISWIPCTIDNAKLAYLLFSSPFYTMSNPTPKRLILIDGSSFLFRAFHAVPALSNKAGMPTNAIYGVANMLRKLISDYQTEYFTVVFDAKGKTFRHELYPAYKANRPAMDDNLRVQIEPLQQLIRTMGLPLIIEEGVEADDVLGALAQKAASEGFEVIISTGDKDMAQLVTEQIILEDSMTGKARMDIAGVIEKFGVKPTQIVDYLALMGDKSDNIPGVAGVGEKTAAKWLAQYENIDNLIAHADEIKGKVGENLRANLAQLALSKTLTTIKTDLNLPYSIEDLKTQQPDYAQLKQQVAEFGFNSWLKQLESESNLADSKNQAEVNPEPVIAEESVAVQEDLTGFNNLSALKKDYQTILTQQQLDEWLAKLHAAPLFAFDTETTSLNYMEAQIVGLSFAVDCGTAAYLPLAHDYVDVPQQLNREAVLAQFKPLLEDAHKPKLGQNLKYDAHILANHGITLRGMAHDTMLESYVWNSTATRHNMDDLAKQYLGIETIAYEDVAGKGAKQILFSEVALEQATPYAAEDADITLQLHETLFPQLQTHERLAKVYRELEIPLIPVLLRMERNGVLIDCDMLAQQSMELASQLCALEQHAHDLAGQSFNLSSPKQIQAILYDKMELPIIKKTPTGQPSTDESVLQELALEYPLPKVLLEHRSLSKLKSTYTDKLPQQINSKTGRVHTSYHQAIAATGRLSSSEPNLQNIPIRTAEGRKIRQAFIAPQGWKILAADYSQIELRIMAHLSQDVGLLSAFSNNQDIHTATAAEVFEVAPEQVTTDLRRSAKAINFGLIYGMSAFGLAQQLGIGRSEAQSYINLYFERYPGVKAYMDSTRELAKQQGFVETILGRRLYLPEINSKNKALQQYAERTAINAPMQGTAADIIKLAMLATDAWLEQEQPPAKMLMQVHDELVFEVREDYLTLASEKIKTLMSSALQLAVPLLVEIGIGNNWDEAH